MARALVIGYGNTLRADDGLGPAVAERLGSEWADEDVGVLSCQLLTPELAEPVSRAEIVVFIDAAAASFLQTLFRSLPPAICSPTWRRTYIRIPRVR